MSRYTGWHQRVGTEGADPFVIDLAQKLLGYVVRYALQNGMGTYQLRREYHGYIVEASYKGGIPKIEITPPPGLKVPLISHPSDIWIPRGFVVYPGSALSLYGWGMPVIQSTLSGTTPYSAINLAPGLDVSRWTPAGPLGQVLLSAVPKAGYPKQSAQIAPLAFSQTFGPKPKKRADGKRVDVYEDSFLFSSGSTGYRMEFVDFTDVAHSEQLSARRRIFELTNAHRAGIGRDPVSLPIRGYYSAAQIYADMESATSTFGHYAVPFWPTYKTPPDRVAKDGMPRNQTGPTVGIPDIDSRDFMVQIGENNIASAQSFVPIGTDPSGETILSVVGAVSFVDPNVVFNAWLASPPHKATIEDVLYDKFSSFLDTGTKGGFATQDFSSRDKWIGVGNACWHSKEPEVPVISWDSFHSLNLAFEMWPISINTEVPIREAVLALFLSTPPAVNLTLYNHFWMVYAYKNVSNTDVVAQSVWTRPALTSSLYMRGRLIGIVPHGGYVLGAAVQKLPTSSGQPQMYRIVALVHVEADQVGTTLTAGSTPILHIYTIDLPDVDNFAVHSDSVIKGVRGSPVSVFPWQVVDDPWAWVDAGTVDVSSSGAQPFDLLTYASLWRFNHDGSRAVCLRQQATIPEILADLRDVHSGIPAAQGIFEAFGISLVRPIELNIPITNSPASHSLNMLTLSEGETLVGGPPVHGYFDKVVTPLAADYAANGSIECVYYVSDQSGSADTNPAFNYAYYGLGPLGLTKASTLTKITSFYLPTLTTAWSTPCVLDVRDVVFVLLGMTDDMLANGCWLYNIGDVVSVSTYRQGALLDMRWFSNPDGNLFEISMSSFYTDCHGVYNGLGLLVRVVIRSIARFVQGSYATNRAGDWVLGYQLLPQSGGQTRAHTTGTPIQYADGSVPPNTCTPSWGDYLQVIGSTCDTSHFTQVSEVSSRGGWCTSSFASNANLATLTGTPGSGVFFSRVGVV